MTHRLLQKILFISFCRTVIFSDECSFCIFGIKGRKLVWRKPCTALQKEHLVPTESATKLGLGQSFRFQHDNDPKHTAENVKLWLLFNVTNQLHMTAQLSDLKPTEH
ncbi:transposable element Tc1 transposase [Trichonephila clavipes]|nr:transposable element Tc1 transposase [Trichonephila clavipes]